MLRTTRPLLCALSDINVMTYATFTIAVRAPHGSTEPTQGSELLYSTPVTDPSGLSCSRTSELKQEGCTRWEALTQRTRQVSCWPLASMHDTQSCTDSYFLSHTHVVSYP